MNRNRRGTTERHNTMIPTIGRIVHYTLTQSDAEQINRLRVGFDILKPWPTTAQRHVGNLAQQGHMYPAMIVRCWGSTEGSACQLQVFLDGNDTYWATSRIEGEGPSHWAPPVMAKP